MPKRRRPHTAHRFRVISRCPTCRAKLLSGCSYRSRRGGACIAVRDERPRDKTGRRFHQHYASGVVTEYSDRIVRTVEIVDLTREARRIFGDMIAPGGEIGL